jgi:hypothetical protein
MPRLTLLLEDLRSKHVNDWYLLKYKDALSQNQQWRSLFKTYDRVLDTLDDPSWAILKAKASEKFKANTVDRGKHQFFDVLNESFAYRYLLQRGASGVVCLPESKQKGQKTPDFSFIENGKKLYCEVKTINISDDEIIRTKRMQSFDGSVYYELPPNFLNGKLVSVVEQASSQIAFVGDGFMYLIISFDDFTHSYYDRYRSQLKEFLASEFPGREIYIKIGLQSRKRIHLVSALKQTNDQVCEP